MTDQLPKLGKIDPGEILLEELAEVERVIGRKLGREILTGDLGMDTMQALVWVSMRRTNPDATFEQAGKYDLMTLTAMFEDEEVAAEPDPPVTPSSSNGSKPNDEPSSNTLPASAISGG